MAAYILTFLLAAHVLTPAWGLQVTPNSACASACMDYSAADPSDPNVSNTFTTDIVCGDSDYNSTSVGSKYKNCLNCLQNSTTTASGETDQAWYLYNLRFAFNTCLFSTSNATHRVDSPCALASVCNPLKGPIQESMPSPSLTNEYSYCTASNNTFTSSYLNACQECLKQNTNTYVLSNFLVALDAGCIQQPVNGTLLGLDGTLFAHQPVKIVDPIIAAIQAAKGPHKVLTRGAIAGIVVAGLVGLMVIASCTLVCVKKRSNAKRLQQLRSPLNSHFGASISGGGGMNGGHGGAYEYSASVTTGTRGMYKSPPTSPPTQTESVQMTAAPQVRNFSFNRGRHEQPAQWEESMGDSRMSNAPSPAPPSYDPRDSRLEPFGSNPYIPPQYTPPAANRSTSSPGYGYGHGYGYSSPSAPQEYPQHQTPLPAPRPHPQRSPSMVSSVASSIFEAPTPPRSPMPAPVAIAGAATRTVPTPRHDSPLPLLQIQTQTNLQPSPSPRPPALPYRQPSPLPPPPPRPNLATTSHPLNPLTLNPRVLNTNTSSTRSTSKSVDDAKRARERLYREGFGGANGNVNGNGNGIGSGTMAHSHSHAPEEVDKSPAGAETPESASTAMSQWPGSF